jgi:prepilin-type N-terminal cleavage/methylation domain-containing protein
MRRRAETGLTLVEVLAAVAILGVAVTPIMGMLTRGLGASRRGEGLSRSLVLAESKYEQLKSRIQSTVPPYGYAVDYNQGVTAFPAPDNLYKSTVTDDRAAALRTLRITVWCDENGSNTVDGSEIPVVLTTRVADRT